MKRKFLSSLLLLVLLNLLVKPFYILGIDAEVQNRVGEEVYGNYYALLNFSFLLNILLDLGITNYNTRNIAQNPQLLAKNFFKILSLRFSLFALYATFTLISGVFVGFSSTEFYLLGILMFNQFLVAIIQFSRSNFTGLHLFKTDALISVLDRFLLIVFCSLLLWTNLFGAELKIEWFVYAQTLAYGLSALVSLAALKARIGAVKLKITKVFSMVLLKQSFPYALLIFLMMMYNRIDAVMLNRMLEDGDRQAGIYAQGFRFLDAVNMFALLFAGLLLPIFARILKQKQDVSEMLYLAFRILAGLSIVTALICFWFQAEIMQLRYPSAVAESASTFGLLILSFIPVSITYVFGTALTANGSLKHLNYMAVFGVFLNIVLNLILINEFKAVGAAMATLITQVVTALIQVALVYRLLKLKFNSRVYMSLLALPVLLLGALWSSQKFELMDSTILEILLFWLLGVVICFGLKIFRMSDVKEMISSRSLVGKEDEG